MTNDELLMDFIKNKKIEALEELYGCKYQRKIANLNGKLAAYNEILEFINVGSKEKTE